MPSTARTDGRPSSGRCATRCTHGLGLRFNFVLANLYRDGNDALGWHADNERELGLYPCIASLSFGASRRFCMRARARDRRFTVLLEPGSLLLMWGTSQRDWQHSCRDRGM